MVVSYKTEIEKNELGAHITASGEIEDVEMDGFKFNVDTEGLLTLDTKDQAWAIFDADDLDALACLCCRIRVSNFYLTERYHRTNINAHQ